MVDAYLTAVNSGKSKDIAHTRKNLEGMIQRDLNSARDYRDEGAEAAALALEGEAEAIRQLLARR